MTTGPAQHVREQLPRVGALAAEARREPFRVRFAEVAEIDPPADVERRRQRVVDQVGRRGDAQQTERQERVRRILGAARVALADRREELPAEKGRL